MGKETNNKQLLFFLSHFAYTLKCMYIMQFKSVFAYFCNMVVPQQITYLICCPYHAAIACFKCCAFDIIAYTLNFFNRKHNILYPNRIALTFTQNDTFNLKRSVNIQFENSISTLYIHTHAIDEFSRFLLLLTYSNACVCVRACMHTFYVRPQGTERKKFYTRLDFTFIW